MSLALLEDLIAVEDVADLAECGPLLAWLDGHGLLDTSRVLACAWCKRPYVRSRDVSHQRYCSLACRRRADHALYDERHPGRANALWKARYHARRRAQQEAA